MCTYLTLRHKGFGESTVFFPLYFKMNRVGGKVRSSAASGVYVCMPFVGRVASACSPADFERGYSLTISNA